MALVDTGVRKPRSQHGIDPKAVTLGSKSRITVIGIKIEVLLRWVMKFVLSNSNHRRHSHNRRQSILRRSLPWVV
jgi:hypothetical protein